MAAKPFGGLGTGGYGSNATGKLAVATGGLGGGMVASGYNLQTLRPAIPIKPLPGSSGGGTVGYPI
jgi:hypothetical protein